LGGFDRFGASIHGPEVEDPTVQSSLRDEIWLNPALKAPGYCLGSLRDQPPVPSRTSHVPCAGWGGAAIAAGLGEFAARGVGGGVEYCSVVRRYGDVDVFEDLAGGDADYAVGGFDEVVTFAAGVLAAE
jgi:hypothetical protein